MKKITAKAPAKINLGLSILSKLNNGYHELKTIYVQLDLYDQLEFNLQKKKISIYCRNLNISVRRNLVYQAASLLQEISHTKLGVRIKLIKNIPVGSGLGGGSSDAAATLRVLNKLWQINYPENRLIRIATKLGADVAYHIAGGVKMEILGGERAGCFYSLPALPNDTFIVLCIPDKKFKSRKAFQSINYQKIGRNNLNTLIKAIENRNLKQIANNFHNDFEIWTIKEHLYLKDIKARMLKNGALNTLMSGKGPAVYAFFDHKKQAQNCYKNLKAIYKNTFLTKPI